VPLDDELVEVVGLDRIEVAQAKSSRMRRSTGASFAHLGLEAVVQSCGAEPGGQLVGAGGVDAVQSRRQNRR